MAATPQTVILMRDALTRNWRARIRGKAARPEGATPGGRKGAVWRCLVLCVAALLPNGCATYLLHESTGQLAAERHLAEWSHVRFDSAYLGPGDELLVLFRARAPRGHVTRRFHSVIPLAPLLSEVRKGYVERRETQDTQGRTNVEEILAGVRYADFRREVPRREIRPGWQRPAELEAAGWIRLPVVALPEPAMAFCTWDALGKLTPPAGTEPGLLYYPVCERDTGSFAVTLAEPVLGVNHSLAFAPEGDSYRRVWILGFRVLLPVTMAVDIVTLPIQVPVLIYEINSMQWF